MLFTLASRRVRNTILTNVENQPVFEIYTPWTWSTRTTTLRKLRNSSGDVEGNPEGYDDVADIVWQTVDMPKIRVHDKEVEGTLCAETTGVRNIIFDGPDGRSYKWRLLDTVSLELNDTSEAPIAHFHKQVTSSGTAIEPCLEIFSAGEHMVDVIISTFICAEKLRRLEQKRISRTPNILSRNDSSATSHSIQDVPASLTTEAHPQEVAVP